MTYQKRFEKLAQDERQLISERLITAVTGYLELLISPVVARRIICAILIVAGAHSKVVTQLTGLHERSIRDLKYQLVSGDIDGIFEVKAGRGRKSQISSIEKQIVEEVENGSYQTLQQIVDMVQEKFGIKTSTSAIHRLLKKTRSES